MVLKVEGSRRLRRTLTFNPVTYRDTNTPVDWKRWIFPAIVAAALLGMAAVDFIQTVRSPDVGDVDVLLVGDLWFDPRNRVVDLRSEPASSGDVPVAPSHELIEGWGSCDPAGTWSLGPRAVLGIRLPIGGHRTILLQCRPDPRSETPPWLVVRVNGVACEPIRLKRKMAIRRIEVPDGAIEPGDNRFELLLTSDRGDGKPAAGHRLLARRLVLGGEADVEFATAVYRKPVSLDRDRGAAAIRAPGRLWVRFDVPSPDSVLTFECLYRGAVPKSESRAGVARWFGSPDGTDAITETRISFGDQKSRRIKLYLGNHTGPAVLWIDAAGVSPEAELLLVSPTVVVGGR
jgi:hypothetical protein